MAKRAILAHVVPRLRSAGFEGTFPIFRRIEPSKHVLIWVTWGRAGGFVEPLLFVVSPVKASTIAQDRRRALALDPFGPARTSLYDLVPRSRRLLFFFDQAAERWGLKWPTPMTEVLAETLQGPGERWLRRTKPSRVSKRR
jgi:hypothetical protein